MAKKPTPEPTAPAPVVSQPSEPVVPTILEEAPSGASSENDGPVSTGPTTETGVDLATSPAVSVPVALAQTMEENSFASPWVPALEITARTPRRRAGRRFTEEPTTILCDELMMVEIKLLRDDPELSVKDIQVPIINTGET